MAIILYKLHVDSLDFPWPQTTIDIFPDSQAAEVIKFVDDHNNARHSTWDIKLGCRSDSTLKVGPEHKTISLK